MVEISFPAARVHADPFNDVTLNVRFTEPGGVKRLVPAFWAGGQVWKVRYASMIPGRHTFRSECVPADDAGLEGIAGEVDVRPYTGTNPLYAHGPLQVAANGRYLEHADKTPFFWLGDTWWMGLSHRLRWPEEFQELGADRKAKGFNVVQIVAGLYPDMPPFDPRGANEAGYPWETNYARIRPEYFDAADQRLEWLAGQGITPCIVGAWGYFLPWMGVEKMKAHWRYLIARYGALPVVWCVAGEANLPWYLAPRFPYDDREQVKGWTEVMRHVRATDPFHRLVTIHPTAIQFYTARHATDDPALLDFDMLQTPHGGREAVPVVLKAVRDSRAALPVMPVIDGEASYEMLGDSLPTKWTRRMFWLCLLNGTAGHTYGANGIWQNNRPGDPHGKSPHGGTYGQISWHDAMQLPGSGQLGFAKKLFERYAWQRFEPHPEWAACTAAPPVHLAGCSWIWYPEGNPAQDAPVARRWFRFSFILPPGTKIVSASLRVSADDWFSARLNGRALGEGGDWHAGRQFDDLAATLRPGSNVLAVVAENRAANVPANPAGLIACLEIRDSEGRKSRWVTDQSWRCSRTEIAGWDGPGFDDSGWVPALRAGGYGDGPWGQINSGNEVGNEPQCAGIPNGVRFVYVPERTAVEVRQLGPRTRQAATCFDPVTGLTKTLGTLVADDQGSLRCPPPLATDQDWVLVLEPAPGQTEATFGGH